MLENGERDVNARKKLEEIERVFESGKIASIPPAELRYLIEDYEFLKKRVLIA